MNTVHYSANKDEWETPCGIFLTLDAEFDFDLDPCATEQNRKCQLYFDIDRNGLRQRWVDFGSSAFVNPPHSKLKEWITKCAYEASKGMRVVMLIPSRTDTIAWHTHIYDSKLWRFRLGVEVRFLRGRATFLENGKPAVSRKTGKPQGAPFPSCIVIFDQNL